MTSVLLTVQIPNITNFTVLTPGQGPPMLNPVLPADVIGQPPVPQRPLVTIGLGDTALGNQAPPTSPIQVLMTNQLFVKLWLKVNENEDKTGILENQNSVVFCI